jgi:hypothetical protein
MFTNFLVKSIAMTWVEIEINKTFDSPTAKGATRNIIAARPKMFVLKPTSLMLQQR